MSFVEDMHQQAKKGAEVIAKTNAKKLVVLDSYDTSLVRHESGNIRLLFKSAWHDAFLRLLLRTLIRTKMS